MTISDIREKCKTLVAKAPRDILFISILILASLASFGLGFLAGMDSSGNGSGAPVLPEVSLGATVGEIVASKGGTKYYLPECSGATRISDENKIWFVSEVAAREAGYSRATNCKGF